MRDLVVAWGRRRWPGARMVHELTIGECRVDVAFIDTHHVAGVEIKSSLDNLDRLSKQVDVFRRGLPEFWLALAPKWVDVIEKDYHAGAWSTDKIIVDGEVREPWGGTASVDRRVTVPLLDLLWRDELAAIARRKRLLQVASGITVGGLAALLARRLTGDEIVAEACAELRARSGGRMGPAFAGGDPPVKAVGRKP